MKKRVNISFRLRLIIPMLYNYFIISTVKSENEKYGLKKERAIYNKGNETHCVQRFEKNRRHAN